MIAYEIDSLNRRIAKKVNGTVTRRWIYMDQYRIAAELNAAGTITKRFVYGSKGNIPDYVIASGVKYRMISDHLGSPRLVVRQSNGSVLARMDHDEFGRVIEDTNVSYLPFGFAGGLYDPDTKLVRFGARDYDPEVGRWTSKDPILFGGGDTNLYGYVMNDPVNFVDPSGLIFQEIFAKYLNPNQQLALGGAMAALGARIAITGGMSVNPAVFAFGLALGMEGAANFNHARTRGAPEFNLFDDISGIPPKQEPNSCFNASR